MSSKNQNPKLKVENTFFDWLIELISLAVMIFLVFFLRKYWSEVPARIPTSYAFDGTIKAYGSKNSLLMLYLVIVGMYIILSFSVKFPYRFNFTVKITEENAYKQYRIARRMMSIIKLEVILIFGYLVISQINGSIHHKAGISPWFGAVVMVGMFSTIAIFVIKSFRNR
jgi:uncharacterized membrane protein